MSSIATDTDISTLESEDTIATEIGNRQDDAWFDCMTALEELRTDNRDDDTPAPTRSVIQAAIAWLGFLRQRIIEAPSLVTFEPSGGVIIEWQRADFVSQLTIYNNHTADLTEYARGQVTDLRPADFDPSSSYF